MALWRFLKVLFAAILIFVVVNFFLSNTSPEAQSLAVPISFKFSLPPFYTFESIDFSVGYLLILSFIIGMIFAALIGAINAFSRSKQLKMKKKTIHELEKEIDELRDLLAKERSRPAEENLPVELNQVPESPEIN